MGLAKTRSRVGFLERDLRGHRASPHEILENAVSSPVGPGQSPGPPGLWRIFIFIAQETRINVLVYYQSQPTYQYTNHFVIENHRSLIQICITPSVESTS